MFVRYLDSRGVAGLGLSLEDVMDAAGEVAEHALTAGDLDFTDFLMISGTRYEPASEALTTVCDKICGRLGKLLLSVGGSLRMLREGFKASVRGGAATFERVNGACTRYGNAKQRRAEAVAAAKRLGSEPEGIRAARVKAETDIALAQKEMIEVLGGSLVTASTQERAEAARAEKVSAAAVPQIALLPSVSKKVGKLPTKSERALMVHGASVREAIKKKPVSKGVLLLGGAAILVGAIALSR